MIFMPTEIVELVLNWSSIKRIEAFLYASEIQKQYIALGKGSDLVAVSIKNGTFFWGAERDGGREDGDGISEEVSML